MNIKYVGRLVVFKNAVQVETDNDITCAIATFTSHRQELTPRYPLRDRLKLIDGTVTPSLSHAFRNVDDDIGDEEETADNDG